MTNVLFFPFFTTSLKQCNWTHAKNLVCLKIFFMMLTLLYFCKTCHLPMRAASSRLSPRARSWREKRGGLDDKLINNIELNLNCIRFNWIISNYLILGERNRGRSVRSRGRGQRRRSKLAPAPSSDQTSFHWNENCYKHKSLLANASPWLWGVLTFQAEEFLQAQSYFLPTAWTFAPVAEGYFIF